MDSLNKLLFAQNGLITLLELLSLVKLSSTKNATYAVARWAWVEDGRRIASQLNLGLGHMVVNTLHAVD